MGKSPRWPSQRPRNSPVAMGDFGELSPETKLQAPQIEIWNTINQCFCQISECQALRTNVKTLIEDFLATVLPRHPNSWSSCTKSNHLLGPKKGSLVIDWYQNRKEALSYWDTRWPNVRRVGAKVYSCKKYSATPSHWYKCILWINKWWCSVYIFVLIILQ